MIKLTKYYKRLRVSFLRSAIFAAFVCVFLMPGLELGQDGGNNYFTVTLNGTLIGHVDSRETVDEYMMEARERIARRSEGLVYTGTDLEIEADKVFFGRIDAKRKMVDRMEEALNSNVIQTLKHSYTVKVNEYSVNLASSEEVISLLEASLGKYDDKNQYDVHLILDPTRELNVLTAKVQSNEEAEKTATPVLREAGVEAYMEEIFDAIEPAGEKDFGDFKYGLMSMDFAENIEIVDAFLMESEITPLETAIDQVTKDQEVNVMYEVVSGDTLSGIAEKTNIPMEKIIALNANLKDENSTIRAGEELIVTVPEPELSIVRTEQSYVEEDYDAEVIYIDNDAWYTTDEVTRQEPSAGHRNAVALVTYRNDKEISREIVKEEILLEAVPKIVERGTKIPPSYIKPISGGRITSNFGRRRAPTKGASTYHKGIDWGIPRGSSVAASSGGTVIKAGWGGGYGYVVYIRHPDGMETRYAHLSKVLVSSGQYVKQGQRIALTGNTGVSTGPHLHFEMRKNGTPVNPLGYI